jgi:streptogramin lyase
MKRFLSILALTVLTISLLIMNLTGVGANGAFPKTYTLDADFDGGTMLNVNHDSPNNKQLQLNTTTEPFPFIWIACSARGTIVRVDVNSGAILGEYYTSPADRGRDPSRTTVDLYGNVWAGNRAEVTSIGNIQYGSVIKVGIVVGGTRCDVDGSPNVNGDYLKPPFDYSTAVDRNGDGLIKTSRGAGDLRPWPAGTDGVGSTDGNGALVQDAEDECILIYQRTPNGGGVRHVSVDNNNDVWVGNFYNYNPQTFNKLDGDTGAVLAPFSFSAFDLGAGGYGGLVDGNGVLWSASLNQGGLIRYDTNSATGTFINTGMLSYGMGIDNNGNIWNSQWTNNFIFKFTPAGATVAGFPKTFSGADGLRGVVITPVDNNVWVASSWGNRVSRLDNNGVLIKNIELASLGGYHPTGVAVDSNGKVWVTNLNSNNAMRIDPNAGTDGKGAVDLTVNLGANAGPYNYSDMTGAVAIGSTSPQGTWTKVEDSGVTGTSWGTIGWNDEPQGNIPQGASITVDARAAENQAGLSSETFIPVSDGVAFNLTGRYIEIRVTLKPSSEGISPVLSDLTLYEAGIVPTSNPTTPVEVGGDIYSVSKVALLTPWIASAIILVAGAAILIWRRRTQS